MRARLLAEENRKWWTLASVSFALFMIMLDNTVVIYGSSMGNSNVHNHKRCPLILLGHGGGSLKGNMHVRAADGTPMANAMLATLRGIGVDLDKFGDSTAVMDLNAAGASTVAEEK